MPRKPKEPITTSKTAKRRKLKVASETDNFDFNLIEGTEKPNAIDVRSLYKEHDVFTYDPGFMSTASCMSAITYIDGAKGILRYGGYSIEELVNKSNYLETCYLLINGELPNRKEYKQFDADVNDISVSDSIWYALFDVNGNPISNFETFMGDTSYEYYFDSTQINGVDTLIEYKTPLNSIYIYVQDLSLYPITISVVEVWPNTTIYDSSWTIASPDMAIVDNNPDFQQDSLTLYFV